MVPTFAYTQARTYLSTFSRETPGCALLAGGTPCIVQSKLYTFRRIYFTCEGAGGYPPPPPLHMRAGGDTGMSLFMRVPFEATTTVARLDGL